MNARKLTRLVAPWIVAAAILAYLFANVSIAEAWQATRVARLDLFLPGVLGATAAWFVLESAAFAYLFSRFNAKVTWAEARSLRGVTYLLTPINWNLATAGIILHLRRSKRISAIASASSMLFYGAIDGIVLSSLALIGVLALPPSPELVAIRNGAAFFIAALVVMLTFFMAPAPGWGWLERARSLGIFRTHSMASLSDVAILMSIRSVYFSGFVGLFWLGCLAFGIDAPFGVIMASMPPILIAAALPITPAGLGTQQAAMLFFWKGYGDPAAILAFGLAFPIGVTLARCLLGLRYVRDLAEMRTATKAASLAKDL